MFLVSQVLALSGCPAYHTSFQTVGISTLKFVVHSLKLFLRRARRRGRRRLRRRFRGPAAGRAPRARPRHRRPRGAGALA